MYQRQIDLLRQQSTAGTVVVVGNGNDGAPLPPTSPLAKKAADPAEATTLVSQLVEENERLKREADRAAASLKTVKGMNEKMEQEVCACACHGHSVIRLRWADGGASAR